MILSPITHSNNIAFQYHISCDTIIKNYKNIFNIDVSRYFNELSEISVYKCLDTQYRFFYPLNIDGDGKFYEQLQVFDWYYMEWKWEHEIASSYLNPQMKILEVGCANGEFLAKTKNRVNEVVGLELNEAAVLSGIKNGIKILNNSVQDHAQKYKEQYDLVCSFQVLEHISDVRSFLIANVALLKKNGTLIISVPNNDSFLGLSTNYLNMPPHHMGLWNETSLKKITDIFNLKIKKVHFEPLQDYHKTYFINTMIGHYLKKYSWGGDITRKIVPRIIPRIISFFSSKTKAFTIQVVYTKLS